MYSTRSSYKKDVEMASDQRQTTARDYFDNRRWRDLWTFKKTCKKSWEALGFTTREVERIKINKPDWI